MEKGEKRKRKRALATIAVFKHKEYGDFTDAS